MRILRYFKIKEQLKNLKSTLGQLNLGEKLEMYRCLENKITISKIE